MKDIEKIATDLGISLFEAEEELKKTLSSQDTKRSSLRIWQLWNRSQKLFQEFLKSTYVQSLQWLKELRCFENKLIHLKESLIQKWYQLS